MIAELITAVIGASAFLRVLCNRVDGLTGEVLAAVTFPLLAWVSLGMPAPYLALGLALGVLLRAVIVLWSAGGDRGTIAASGVADASTILIWAGPPLLFAGNWGRAGWLFLGFAGIVAASTALGSWPRAGAGPLHMPTTMRRSARRSAVITVAACRVAPRDGRVAASFPCVLRFETAFAGEDRRNLLIWRPWLTGTITRVRMSGRVVREIRATLVPRVHFVKRGVRSSLAVRRALRWRWGSRRVACAAYLGGHGVREIDGVTITAWREADNWTVAELRRGSRCVTVWEREANGVLLVDWTIKREPVGVRRPASGVGPVTEETE